MSTGMASLAELVEKHDLTVLCDEAYFDIRYDGESVSFASLPGMSDRTITLGGFSKNYAMTGWRIGYGAAAPEILAAMRKIHQYTIMSAPTISQIAAIAALEHANDHVLEMVAEYDRRRRLIVSGLNELGLSTFEPCGAFYAFPSITASGMDDETFADTLLAEEKVETALECRRVHDDARKDGIGREAPPVKHFLGHECGQRVVERLQRIDGEVASDAAVSQQHLADPD